MKPALLKYLRCTSCNSPLKLEVFEQSATTLTPAEKDIITRTQRNISEYESEILSGVLRCDCGIAYPISNGVSRMVLRKTILCLQEMPRPKWRNLIKTRRRFGSPFRSSGRS